MSPERTRTNSLAHLDPLLSDLSASEFVREIPLGQVITNPAQVRTTFNDESIEQLANSIRAHGLLHPIIVSERKSENGNLVYDLIAGERRYRASVLNGVKTIKAIVKDIPKDNILINQLIENVQREDLTISEKARAFYKLKEKLGSVEEVSKQVGLSISLIYKYINLGEAEPLVHDVVKKADLGIDDANKVISIVETMRKDGLGSVAKVLDQMLSAEPVSKEEFVNELNSIDEKIHPKKAKRKKALNSVQHGFSISKGFINLNIRVKSNQSLSNEDKEKYVSFIEQFKNAIGISN